MFTQPTRILMLLALMFSLFTLAYAMKLITVPKKAVPAKPICCSNLSPNHACVMKTIFGLDSNHLQYTSLNGFKPSEEATAAMQKGVSWIIQAQAPNGGWGAGDHSRQDITDPHAVSTDPATTSLVALSLLRTGHSLTEGAFADRLKKATLYLLGEVENWPADRPYLTTLTGTQPQTKLGQNIDAILTAQFLTNLLQQHSSHPWNTRIKNNLSKLVNRIQQKQDTDGGWKDGGWAPVLQSALADNALETAQEAGIPVDEKVLEKSKRYQKGNFDTATKSSVTDKAAGIMLYSLSSTSRSSAKEAKAAKDIVSKAKKDGKVEAHEMLSEESLQKSGVDPVKAKQLITAYNINESSKKEAIKDDVMNGFGNNGGEEFLSYLMTGESIMMQGNEEWKTWYAMMTKKLTAIQNSDGSWNGHHCITSPVFCTATCLLILSIHNDLRFKGPIK
jgi:hypothetical protein